MKVVMYDEWIRQTENLVKQQTALLKAQDAIGKSAYEIALGELGKTEEELPLSEWLESLNGSSAYDIYVENYDGDGNPLSESLWLESLAGETGKSAYESAIDGGFIGDEEEFNQILATIGDLHSVLDEINGEE